MQLLFFKHGLVGPLLNILGFETPAFKLPFGFSLSPKNLMNYEDNLIAGTRKVTIGLNELSHEKFDEDPYEHIKELIESFDKAPSTASWNSLKGIINNAKKLDFKVGVDMSGSLLGFLEYDLRTGEILDSGLLIIGEAGISARAPIYPLVFLKFEVEGNMTGTNISFKLTNTGKINTSGSIEFDTNVKAGLEFDAFIANAYAGASGGILFNLKDLSNIKNSFEVSAHFSLFIELGLLFWGDTFEYNFPNITLYPHEQQNQLERYSISKNDLKFIEPINRVSTYSNNPDVFLSNVQAYTSPQIVSIGGDKMLMLYIDDATSRSAENRTTLMYSIYDGTQWSAPLAVLDDGTADFEPKVYPDGNGGAHIIWQNAKTSFGSDISIDKMVPNMELHYTHWNGNSFDSTATLTSNSIYESRHTIAASGNDISVVWQENSENDPFGLTGTNKICRKQFKNGTWQSPEIIVSGLNPIRPCLKNKSCTNGYDLVNY